MNRHKLVVVVIWIVLALLVAEIVWKL